MSPLPEPCLSKGRTIAASNRGNCAASSAWLRSGHFCFPAQWRRIFGSVPPNAGRLCQRKRSRIYSPRSVLKGYAQRDVANLSGGEAQRVSVARTLANTPLVLLLDEPTSALDEAAKLEVESSIQKVVRNQGLTCVVVTHDLAQASRLAERALVLKSGRIVRDGLVGEVLHA